MEKTQYMTMAEHRSSDVEIFILSAQRKYFERNLETVGGLNGAESVLYDAVISYFRATPKRQS